MIVRALESGLVAVGAAEGALAIAFFNCTEAGLLASDPWSELGIARSGMAERAVRSGGKCKAYAFGVYSNPVSASRALSWPRMA